MRVVQGRETNLADLAATLGHKHAPLRFVFETLDWGGALQLGIDIPKDKTGVRRRNEFQASMPLSYEDLIDKLVDPALAWAKEWT